MVEKRQHSRILVQDLHAEICVTEPGACQQSILQGSVIDMSNSGIKIKLLSPMPHTSSMSKISIVLTNSNLSNPMTIKGMVRHISVNNECGVAFSNQTENADIDEFLFECVRNNATN
jgi:hypothetical protein